MCNMLYFCLALTSIYPQVLVNISTIYTSVIYLYISKIVVFCEYIHVCMLFLRTSHICILCLFSIQKYKKKLSNSGYYKTIDSPLTAFAFYCENTSLPDILSYSKLKNLISPLTGTHMKSLHMLKPNNTHLP
jgi:hypothetical protein